MVNGFTNSRKLLKHSITFPIIDNCSTHCTSESEERKQNWKFTRSVETNFINNILEHQLFPISILSFKK